MAAKSNAERQKEWRARQALKKQNQSSGSGDNDTATGVPDVGAGPVAAAAEPEDEQISVTVNAPAEPIEAHASLKGFLFGQKKPGIEPIKKPATRSGRRGAKQDMSLVSQVLPVALAGLMVTFVRDKLPEEYRPCAPTQAEASAILRPLFEEISRYFEVSGKVSETTLNLAKAVIAALAYGARAYTTYVEIKHDQQKTGVNRHEQTSSNQQSGRPGSSERPATYGDGYRGNQGQAIGLDGNDVNGYAGNQRGGYAGNDSGAGANLHDGSEQSEQSDADKVADLFKRDRSGRVKLGLLAG